MQLNSSGFKLHGSKSPWRCPRWSYITQGLTDWVHGKNSKISFVCNRIECHLSVVNLHVQLVFSVGKPTVLGINSKFVLKSFCTELKLKLFLARNGVWFFYFWSERSVSSICWRGKAAGGSVIHTCWTFFQWMFRIWLVCLRVANDLRYWRVWRLHYISAN